MTLDIARHAFGLLTDVVSGLAEADWDRPSNLDSWTVRDVVAHVTGSIAKVRALALDEPVEQQRSDPTDWRRDDPAGVLRGLCESALVALADADPTAPREMRGMPMPLEAAVAFPVVDAIVHAWDVRRSVGQPLDVPAPLLEYATRLTERVGDAPNPNFAPPVSPAADASPTEQLMNRLGRRTR